MFKRLPKIVLYYNIILYTFLLLILSITTDRDKVISSSSVKMELITKIISKDIDIEVDKNLASISISKENVYDVKIDEEDYLCKKIINNSLRCINNDGTLLVLRKNSNDEYIVFSSIKNIFKEELNQKKQIKI